MITAHVDNGQCNHNYCIIMITLHVDNGQCNHNYCIIMITVHVDNGQYNHNYCINHDYRQVDNGQCQHTYHNYRQIESVRMITIIIILSCRQFQSYNFNDHNRGTVLVTVIMLIT